MTKHLFVVIILLFATTASAQKPTKKIIEENQQTLKEALALQQQGRLAESNQKLTDLYALRFMTDFVSWNLANNYYSMQDYKRAERFASEAMSDGSQYVLQAGILKSMCLSMRNKSDEELQLLKQLASHFRDEPSSHFALAVHLWNHNERHNANSEFQKAVNLDKANPSMHLRIAYLNNESKLYIHSYLAYYMYLFINPGSYAKETITILNEIMTRRDVNTVIDELTANDALLSQEDNDLIWAMLFINELSKKWKTPITNTESDPNDVDNFVENFVGNSKKLLTSVCKSIDNRNGFYEEFYIDFYQKLINDDMLDAFLYYCLAKTYPDNINTAIPMTKEKMEEFAKWLENNFG